MMSAGGHERRPGGRPATPRARSRAVGGLCRPDQGAHQAEHRPHRRRSTATRSATVEVRLAPDGTIVGRKLVDEQRLAGLGRDGAARDRQDRDAAARHRRPRAADDRRSTFRPAATSASARPPAAGAAQGSSDDAAHVARRCGLRVVRHRRRRRCRRSAARSCSRRLNSLHEVGADVAPLGRPTRCRRVACPTAARCSGCAA